MANDLTRRPARGAIRLRGVKKSFPAYYTETLKGSLLRLLRGQRLLERRTILDGLDLDIAPGERVGIIGRNGAGKSTLFRLMSGILTPDAGSVEIGGRVSPLIEITAGLVPDMTGGENIRINASILGLRRDEIEERFDEIVAFADLREFVDTPVRFYSSGMMGRLGFAVATHVDADVVLIDEVLAVGDARFQRRCLDRIDELSNQGATVILVSHDIDAIARHMERVVWLDGVIREQGPPSDIVQAYVASMATSVVASVKSNHE